MSKTNKEEEIKNNLEVIKDHAPQIIEGAEECEFKVIVKNAKSLLNYAEKIGEKYSKADSYIEDMNEACNNMFNFMRENKLAKKLKSTIVETILATYHINELLGLKAISIQQYDNGRYEGQMKDGKR